jgi:hypothetical protein
LTLGFQAKAVLVTAEEKHNGRSEEGKTQGETISNVH